MASVVSFPYSALYIITLFVHLLSKILFSSLFLPCWNNAMEVTGVGKKKYCYCDEVKTNEQNEQLCIEYLEQRSFVACKPE